MQENGKADAKEEGGREIKLTLPSLARCLSEPEGGYGYRGLAGRDLCGVTTISINI